MRRTLNLNRGLKWSLLLVLICGASCSKGYNKHADDYYEQGMLFYETMEYGRSIDSFTKVLELAPGGQENNRVYFMRGRGYLKSRQFDQAVYDFTKALELTDEGDTETRFLILEMRGDAFLGKNDAEKAIPDLITRATGIRLRFSCGLYMAALPCRLTPLPPTHLNVSSVTSPRP